MDQDEEDDCWIIEDESTAAPDTEKIRRWLEELGCSPHADAFAKVNPWHELIHAVLFSDSVPHH